MSDSSTGGPLLPVEPPVPLEDDDLEEFLQGIIAAIAGIDGQWVRPRWQPEPPNIPPDGQDWAAIGITSSEPDAMPAVIHHSEGEGHDELQRHEELQVLASFYGPHANAYGSRLRDGFYIAQNREALFLAGMGLVNVGAALTVPVLLKQKWLVRVDVPVVIRRAVQRNYAVLNLRTANGTLITKYVSNPFQTEEPDV